MGYVLLCYTIACVRLRKFFNNAHYPNKLDEVRNYFFMTLKYTDRGASLGDIKNSDALYNPADFNHIYPQCEQDAVFNYKNS